MNSFQLINKEWAGSPLNVVEFTGIESISKPYQFDIQLCCDRTDVNPAYLLNTSAKLIIQQGGQEQRTFNGIVSSIKLGQLMHGKMYFEMQLVPKLWCLELSHFSQIFLEQSIPEVIQSVLDDEAKNNLSIKYECNLVNEYPKLDYLCQYNESSLNFISRLMEQQGIYYYFKQTDEEEIVCITDNSLAHETHPTISELTYKSVSGLSELNHSYPQNKTDSVFGFSPKKTITPSKVMLKSFYEDNPDVLLEGNKIINDEGYGTIYSYGDHVLSKKEAERIAKVRSEQRNSQANQYDGRSSAASISSGFTFQLHQHFLSEYNQQYLVTSVQHSGKQSNFLPISEKGNEASVSYQNQFHCISAELQFRPPELANKTKITGVISAIIDGIDENIPLIDEEGRYKVVMPFELSSKQQGRASHWIRLSQPYGGQSNGFHFPLLKGTEVLLTFINGDPDRPIIQSTVPNPNNPSLVNVDNAHINRLKSARGSLLEMDDSEGKEKIRFESHGAIFSIGYDDD